MMLFNIACNRGGNQLGNPAARPAARIVRPGGQRANLGGADGHQRHLQRLEPPVRVIIWIKSISIRCRLLAFGY